MDSGVIESIPEAEKVELEADGGGGIHRDRAIARIGFRQGFLRTEIHRPDEATDRVEVAER